MLANPTATYLKFGHLQMAAEAFLIDRDTGTQRFRDERLKDALVLGNDHSSKFPPTLAADFIKSGYDMNKHGIHDARDRIVGGGLTPDFVRRFAIVGSPDRVTERLLGLRKMGLDRFVAVGPGFYPESWGEARDLFAREVIPALRAA